VREDGRVPAYRICFVCSGNICRSPTAEVVLRTWLAEAGLAGLVRVESAGIGDWHSGGDADERALAALRRRSYPVRRHCARQIQPADLAECDLIIALDRAHVRALGHIAGTAAEAAKVRLLRSFDPAAGSALDVPDPYYGGPDAFDQVLDMIEAGCRGLLDEVRAELATRCR
jgi:protein-tyrosine phosphatase